MNRDRILLGKQSAVAKKWCQSKILPSQSELNLRLLAVTRRHNMSRDKLSKLLIAFPIHVGEHIMDNLFKAEISNHDKPVWFSTQRLW